MQLMDGRIAKFDHEDDKSYYFVFVDRHCSNCKHWIASYENHHFCGRMFDVDSKARMQYSSEGYSCITEPDFYCNEWSSIEPTTSPK